MKSFFYGVLSIWFLYTSELVLRVYVLLSFNKSNSITSSSTDERSYRCHFLWHLQQYLFLIIQHTNVITEISIKTDTAVGTLTQRLLKCFSTGFCL